MTNKCTLLSVLQVVIIKKNLFRQIVNLLLSPCLMSWSRYVIVQNGLLIINWLLIFGFIVIE